MRNDSIRFSSIVLISLAGILLIGAALAGVEISESGVVFTLSAPNADAVYLAGDFNDWSETATPMKLDGGIWRVELELAPRRYEYKFLVDGEYTTDPDNPNTNPDPYGGENSVVTVSPAGEPKASVDANIEKTEPLRVKDVVDTKNVEFSYKAPTAKNLAVAGDFNSWSTDANQMEKGDDGIWRTTIELFPGKYEYKYVVDGDYVTDPNNPEKAPDPYGGENSVINVPEMILEVHSDREGDLIDDGYKGSKNVEVVESSNNAQLATPKPETPGDGTEYTFEYYNPGARQVFIAGDFNSWSPNATEMESDGDGNWSKTVVLKPGKYGYKYIVDGNWQPDPDNPRTQPDGYGGVNSLVEISKSGEVVEAEETGVVERVSNTFANSRVYIGGKYTGIAESRWNHDGDKRFRLDVPRHRMEAYLRVSISDNVRALGALSFDTKDADRIYEAALAMDSAAVDLITDNFRGQIYYNRPVGGLGDPMEIVGESAMAGSPDVELPFGMGTGGIKADGTLFGAHLTGIYADRYYSRAAQLPEGALLDDLGRPTLGLFAEEVVSPSPNPDAYTEYATDILGARISRPVGPMEIGALLRMDSGNWWYSYANLTLPALDDWIDSTGSTSDWFALGKTEWLYGGDLRFDDDAISAWVQYLGYDYYGGIVAGNRENDARDDNGPVNLELGARKGHLGGTGFDVPLFDLLRIGGEYSSLMYSSPEDSGVYIEPMPSTDGDGRVDMAFFEITPEESKTWWEAFQLNLALDKYIPLKVYGGLDKSKDAFSGTQRDAIQYGFSMKGSFLWEFLLYDIRADWADAEFADGRTESEMLSKYALAIHLTENWHLGFDAAYHSISAVSADDSTLWDSSANPFFAYLQYSPVENVRMQVYWGFHPVMANGWVAGRREFIDGYMRENNASYAEAWEELGKIRQIGFRGEMDF